MEIKKALLTEYSPPFLLVLAVLALGIVNGLSVAAAATVVVAGVATAICAFRFTKKYADRPCHSWASNAMAGVMVVMLIAVHL